MDCITEKNYYLNIRKQTPARRDRWSRIRKKGFLAKRLRTGNKKGKLRMVFPVQALQKWVTVPKMAVLNRGGGTKCRRGACCDSNLFDTIGLQNLQPGIFTWDRFKYGEIFLIAILAKTI